MKENEVEEKQTPETNIEEVGAFALHALSTTKFEGKLFVAPDLSVDLTVNKGYYSCFESAQNTAFDNSKRTQRKGHSVRRSLEQQKRLPPKVK